MKTKIQKQYIDYGHGFPVVLENVPMVFARGEWIPDINYNELMRVVVLALAHKPARLTGNEIRFITNYFELTYEAFGKYFDVTKQAAMKWMKTGDEPPSIKWSTERDIRMFILKKLNVKPREFYSAYGALETKASMPRTNKLRIPPEAYPEFIRAAC